MRKKRSNPSGFTLTELSFAVLFIAILLLTVALITNQIVGAYRKGVSMKTINQVGREIIEDVRTSIINSSASYSQELQNHSEYTYKAVLASSAIKSTERGTSASATISNAQLGGLFCTGAYTYIWNTGYVFSDDYHYTNGSPMDAAFTISSGATEYIPRLVRTPDSSRSICKDFDSGAISGEINLTDYEELISSSEVTSTSSRTDAPVAIYDFYIATPPARTANNGRLFYTGSFILGTISGGVNVTTSGNNCKAPDDQTTYANSIFNYCAVNKFNFAVQSSNSK